MKEFECETIIVPKESLLYLRKLSRREHDCPELSAEMLDKYWINSLRFSGMGNSEVRVDYYSFSKNIDELKKLLDDAGLHHREDGVKSTCMVV